jgi:hypothetical protein
VIPTLVCYIFTVISGASSIANCLNPNGGCNTLRAVPYLVSKAAMHMEFACLVRKFEAGDSKVFLYGLGQTVSSFGLCTKAEFRAKPTSEARLILLRRW